MRNRNLALGFGAAFALLAQPVIAAPNAQEAKAFVAKAEAQLSAIEEETNQAFWVQATYVTVDTNGLAAKAFERQNALATELARGAERFDKVPVDAETRRKLIALKVSLTLPAPKDVKANAELSRLVADLNAAYATGKACDEQGRCRTLGEVENVLRQSRDPQEQLDAWRQWHAIAPAMKAPYARMVDLANQGAREVGFQDVGSLWRSGYEMAPDAFEAETDRLWSQVKPLYDALHCHVRAKLADHYGEAVVSRAGPIPAHLLGNMWGQNWGNLYPLVAPSDEGPRFDLSQVLVAQNYDAVKMAKTAEGFFTSLGLDPLPATFWERSMLVKPRDREVLCHASAWDLDAKNDLRVKMCMEPTADHFRTIHHELGHNFYQRAYQHQSYLGRNGAHDGFHEAIGDFIALSVTPKYLVQKGLMGAEPDAKSDTGLLLRQALEGVAFLPFGLIVDKWRWQVFSGQVDPAHYNDAWWRLRMRYQGVARPVMAGDDAFDPGAKAHVPGNTPYMRYFMARILQFQFHKAACELAGDQGPLHRCSIYGNTKVGAKLKAMLEAGSAQPWPQTLQAFTGSPRMDGTALLAYFAPLKTWLDQQNSTRTCGW